MRPTRFGSKAVVFYATLVGAFYAVPYLNLFFLLLAFASVLGLLNLYWTWRNIRGVRGSMSEIAPYSADSRPTAQLCLSSTSTLRCHHHLHAAICIDGKETRLAEHFNLDGNQIQHIQVQLPALPRGIHPVEGLRVGTIYPFGTLVTWRELAAPGHLIVYPKPADLRQCLKTNRVAGLSAFGGVLSEDQGPAGLREYREGDELRSVHWKATARRQELVAKELESDSNPGVEVRLDLRAETEDLEQALSLITALALECRTNKALLTLHTQNHSATYGRDHRPFDQLFLYLAGTGRLPEDSDAPPVVSPSALCRPLTRNTKKQRAEALV
ncbi:MAG: DUF58 domain-containing protein [Planctomycetota bacterium]|nr:DUF58 domain-containing protein [Planctomycetota bacterium]